jgi:hypothetical protein
MRAIEGVSGRFSATGIDLCLYATELKGPCAWYVRVGTRLQRSSRLSQKICHSTSTGGSIWRRPNLMTLDFPKRPSVNYSAFPSGDGSTCPLLTGNDLNGDDQRRRHIAGRPIHFPNPDFGGEERQGQILTSLSLTIPQKAQSF